MKFANCYISSNCNQVPAVVDWGRNNRVCYGSCNSVMIYNPLLGSGGKVIRTLVEHTKRVNSVKWLRGRDIDDETELVSASTDGLAIVWNLERDERFLLKGHESNVNIVDGIYKGLDQEDAVVVSASMDCTIKVWHRRKLGDQFLLNQTLNLGYHICVGIKIALFPNTDDLILATACDDSKIQIYIESEIDEEAVKFEPSVKLVGHEDWVRGFDFTTDDQGNLLLASCSHDTFIRLWKFTETSSTIAENLCKLTIKTNKACYNVSLESVLGGHEGWVYSVNWSPEGLQLLSASIDKSMIIWEFDKESGLWMETVRVGEVGGNTLGFYGGMFNPSGTNILAHSYHGAFHLWAHDHEINEWGPVVSCGGHFDEVMDLAWEPHGEFLVSVSADQTTRVHAPWPTSKFLVTWHELARPQVHGYDMNSLAVLSRYKFASAAEEKVIRTFNAPRNFMENFQRICRIREDVKTVSMLAADTMQPKGASVPSLGLSNKAVYANDNLEDTQALDKKNPYPEESHFTAIEMEEPPTEETLLQNTLWPEVQKLYGHGYEVYSLAASPDGHFLVSACKSTTAEHAAILLWDTSSWKLVQKLMSHTLTVAQIQFSPDSNHILSVSRDRRWSLFTKDSEGMYQLKATTDKKTSIHTRIIWACGWSHDSKYFVTGSRDGKVVVWTINKGKPVTSVLGECEAASDPLVTKVSVNAVAFAPGLVSNSYLVAVGFETGVISLYNWSVQGWNEVLELDTSVAHHLTVKRLAFRPVFGRAGYTKETEEVLQLASCSSDFSVRIYDIFIGKL